MLSQFKLREEGKHSTLTDERMRSLNDLGFVWNSHDAIWHERLEELQRYAAEQGNCNVPKDYPENKGLAIWVKCQRRQVRRLILSYSESCGKGYTDQLF
jgi:Helicase associated domain